MVNLEETAEVVAAVGALNWGLGNMGINVLTYLGSFESVGAWVVGAAGAFVLYKMFV